MKLVRNTGTDRVVDLIRSGIARNENLDMLTSTFSFFAFAELVNELQKLEGCRLILPPNGSDLAILGTAADRPVRNRLQARWLAKCLLQWIERHAEVRRTLGPVPQGAFVLRNSDGEPVQVLLGSLAFTTDGLGLTPGNPMNLIQASENAEEAALLSQWFDMQWAALDANFVAKQILIDNWKELAGNRAPLLIYALILHHIFRDRYNYASLQQEHDPVHQSVDFGVVG
jgi:hypothetical protein